MTVLDGFFFFVENQRNNEEKWDARPNAKSHDNERMKFMQSLFINGPHRKHKNHEVNF